jgi:hypothetical protein
VLPNGFVYCGKDGSNYTLSAKVKQKMKKGPQYGCKQEACHLPTRDRPYHIRSPPLVDVYKYIREDTKEKSSKVIAAFGLAIGFMGILPMVML